MNRRRFTAGVVAVVAGAATGAGVAVAVRPPAPDPTTLALAALGRAYLAEHPDDAGPDDELVSVHGWRLFRADARRAAAAATTAATAPTP